MHPSFSFETDGETPLELQILSTGSGFLAHSLNPIAFIT
jgi:hypothetical protein